MEAARTANQNRFFSVQMKTPKEYVNGFRDLESNKIRTNTLENQSNDSGSEDSVSVTSHDQDPPISDCESAISGPNNEKSQVSVGGLIKLGEGDKLQEIITRRFISGLGSLGIHTSVVAIHRNSFASITSQARLQSFHVFAKAMEKKCGDNANLKYAWYGTSRDEIRDIISYGFSHFGNAENKGLFGNGIYLSPDDSSIDSVESSVVDEDGLRHVLLCRVILGNMELVHPGSKLCYPSSEEFDSGVDNFFAPKKYIVWSTHMNTHILPEYIISFRAPCLKGGERVQTPMKKPTSPWMPFPALVSMLSKFLAPHTVGQLSKHYKDHKEGKISRHELIRRIREMAGDKLLTALIKSYRDKQGKGTWRTSD